MKILIASDNSTYGEYLSYRLIREGHETRIAQDGQQALDMLKQEPWDLLLIGIALNYLTGLEVIKQHRDFLESLPDKEPASTALSPMKIVFITRIRNEKIRKNAVALGASDYLLLPLETSTLLDTIKMKTV